MEDHQLTPEIVQTTLFQHLADNTQPPVKHMLREQYRMTPAIGNMISSCFYDNELLSPNPHELPGTGESTGLCSGWTPAFIRGGVRRSGQAPRPASPTGSRHRSRRNVWRSSTTRSGRGRSSRPAASPWRFWSSRPKAVRSRRSRSSWPRRS
ncbi:AAA domain-containing protein [Streptomyces sp. INA 01156]